jgi:hypothetical protein
MAGLDAAAPAAQDIARQPLPRIESHPAPARTQSFDQPADGARSPRNANYTIDVRLDHVARTITGRETIRWRNISSQTARELQFHLYWNAWRNAESTWMRERRMGGNRTPPRPDAWSSSDVTAVRIAGIDVTSQKRFIAPDDGNTVDQTVMALPLATPVGPNDSVSIDVEWTSNIPRPFARTGYNDHY